MAKAESIFNFSMCLIAFPITKAVCADYVNFEKYKT